MGRNEDEYRFTRLSGRGSSADIKLPPGQHLTTDFPVLSAGPTQWVTVNRIRVKDSYKDMEFLSDKFSEKSVPIGFI